MLDGMLSYAWDDDPKRLSFTFARYKFVAKMLQGKSLVLEVGCADGVPSRIVKQSVGHLCAVDKDPSFIAKAESHEKWPIRFWTHDILEKPICGYDAVYCLDVFEHISEEKRLLQNLKDCAPVCIIGTPSIESQVYASKLSKEGHVNCKSSEELKTLMVKYWRQVFMFGMNDETLHTGFGPMCHYILGIGVN